MCTTILYFLFDFSFSQSGPVGPTQRQFIYHEQRLGYDLGFD